MDSTTEKLENYLIQMDAQYETIEEGTWVVTDNNLKIAIRLEDNIVFFRINLFPLSNSDNSALFKKLLELNAASMLLGAYGIEDSKVVIIDSLTAENIDFNEFQSSVEAISLAAVDHYKDIKALMQ